MTVAPHPEESRKIAAYVGHVGRATVRQAVADDWYFAVSESYPLYELLIDRVLLGERERATDWPPRYRSWRG